MVTPAIVGLATGFPGRRYSQDEAYEQFTRLGLGRNRLARAIFGYTGVGYRHAAVDCSYYAENHGTQARNERYMQEAVPLGEATIRQCLDEAELKADSVDDLIVVSCTGFNIPGLDLHLAARLGMRQDLRRACILGMGCYGAFPGLLRAREAVASQPERLALVLAVELCSLHLQFENTTENFISSALFADGAAAALVGKPEHINGEGRRTPALVDALTHCDYSTFEHMSFSLTDHGFRMYLSSYVPELLASEVEAFVDALLARNALRRGQVRFWGIHPGSQKILDHVQERLGLADEQMEFSHSVLYEHGNMSSPTILFVLDQIQRCAHPTEGDYGVLLAFGPGLTMESMLIQW
jgi:predicted naringenin-chalcone synthase